MDLIIGTGQMGRQYCLALKKLKRDFLVLGNTETSSIKFKEEMNVEVFPGSFANNESIFEGNEFENVYLVVLENQISNCLEELNKRQSFKKVFIEKPGAANPEELRKLAKRMPEDKFFVSYNRRFYQSVRKLETLIKEEGGVTSCHFDFTEATDRILSLNIPNERLEHWLFLNSTHVIDLAFYLIGDPRSMTCKNSGEKSWHGTGDHFMGMGESNRGIPFTYNSDWGCPGRWGIELTTSESKYFLKPMEQLHVQRKGTFSVEEISLEKTDGIKEGIFEIVEDASSHQMDRFLSLSDHAEKSNLYELIKFGGVLS
ncbi:MAG: Gfo/Idh/MocA family oxidoreductase [Halobacteriovoraceae bacterium]|nr:Gfo/Idh/MocA family oxidoreductase [Halobacteriovoraceae bacterium]